MPDFEKVKLVVLDVDGTLTDGGIYYDSQGNEMKRFDVKDGLGIKVGLVAGIEFAVLTGRESPMVAHRVEELGIQHLIQGVQKKRPAIISLMEKLHLQPEQVAYVGDDMNDLAPMLEVGIRACPADADTYIREQCHYVASCSGGHGAVRDFVHYLLEKQNRWDDCIKVLYSD